MDSHGPAPQYHVKHERLYEGGGGPPVVYDDQAGLVTRNVFARTQSVINGSCQIALAVICIVIQSVALGLEPGTYAMVSQGLWGGAMFMATGILGIMAGKRGTRCLIIGFFVLCIITSSIISPGVAAASGLGIYFSRDDPDSGFDFRWGYEDWRLSAQVIIGVMSVIQIGFAIWGCVICGVAVCNCSVWKAVPMNTSPSNSSNFVSQITVGQQVQGQTVLPGGGAYPAVYALQRGAIVYENYSSIQSRISGSAQIIIGILLIAFNATLIGLKPDGLGPVSHGFWGGGAFIITGIFGMVAARNRTRCPVMTYMVTCLVSILLDAGVFITAVVGIVLRLEDCYGYNGDYYCRGHPEAIIAMHGLMLALAVLECGFAIWGSVVAGKVLCGCCSPTMSNRVQFLPTDQMLVGENSNYPAMHNPGYPVNAGPVTMAVPYDSHQMGSYSLPGSQVKIQPW